MEEINFKKANQLINTNHILVDLNFLIYIAIQEVEKECNCIINMIFHYLIWKFLQKRLEILLKIFLKKKHWIDYSEIIGCLLDGSNAEEIINEIKNF